VSRNFYLDLLSYCRNINPALYNIKIYIFFSRNRSLHKVILRNKNTSTSTNLCERFICILNRARLFSELKERCHSFLDSNSYLKRKGTPGERAFVFQLLNKIQRPTPNTPNCNLIFHSPLKNSIVQKYVY
jgi:hypothetical protein